jgi:hypothetical protein
MTGIQIKGYNDIEERDVIESYHEVAIKRNLNSIQNVYNIKNLTCRIFLTNLEVGALHFN